MESNVNAGERHFFDNPDKVNSEITIILILLSFAVKTPLHLVSI